MKRSIIEHGALDPSDNKRTYYVLECGHVVSRRTQGWKRWADCGKCDGS